MMGGRKCCREDELTRELLLRYLQRKGEVEIITRNFKKIETREALLKYLETGQNPRSAIDEAAESPAVWISEGLRDAVGGRNICREDELTRDVLLSYCWKQDRISFGGRMRVSQHVGLHASSAKQKAALPIHPK